MRWFCLGSLVFVLLLASGMAAGEITVGATVSIDGSGASDVDQGRQPHATISPNGTELACWNGLIGEGDFDQRNTRYLNGSISRLSTGGGQFPPIGCNYSPAGGELIEYYGASDQSCFFDGPFLPAVNVGGTCDEGGLAASQTAIYFASDDFGGFSRNQIRYWNGASAQTIAYPAATPCNSMAAQAPSAPFEAFVLTVCNDGRLYRASFTDFLSISWVELETDALTNTAPDLDYDGNEFVGCYISNLGVVRLQSTDFVTWVRESVDSTTTWNDCEALAGSQNKVVLSPVNLYYDAGAGYQELEYARFPLGCPTERQFMGVGAFHLGNGTIVAYHSAMTASCSGVIMNRTTLLGDTVVVPVPPSPLLDPPIYCDPILKTGDCEELAEVMSLSEVGLFAGLGVIAVLAFMMLGASVAGVPGGLAGAGLGIVAGLAMAWLPLWSTIFLLVMAFAMIVAVGVLGRR